MRFFWLFLLYFIQTDSLIFAQLVLTILVFDLLSLFWSQLFLFFPSDLLPFGIVFLFMFGGDERRSIFFWTPDKIYFPTLCLPVNVDRGVPLDTAWLILLWRHEWCEDRVGRFDGYPRRTSGWGVGDCCSSFWCLFLLWYKYVCTIDCKSLSKNERWEDLKK